MEFAINCQLLREELGKLQSVIAKKSAIAILSCIRIESTEYGLKMTATNMESTIHSHITSKMLAVTEQGVMCVEAKKLIDAVRLMPNGPLKISCDPNHWVKIIATGSILRRMPGMDPGLYPEVPDYEECDWFEIPISQMKVMIPSVRFAITQEEGRISLRGAQLEAKGEDIRLVATDGHRVALAHGQLASSSDAFEVLIPVEAIEEVTKLLADQTEGDLGISQTDNALFFRIGDRVLSSRLLAGKFPSYEMPFRDMGTYKHFTTFKADDLVQPIRRAMLCAKNADDSKDSPAALAMLFENGKLRIDAASADLGESNEVFDTNFNGGPLKIYFNGKYLLDFLEPLGITETKMEIKNGNAQAYLSAEKDGVKLQSVIMPMRAPSE